MEGDITLTRGEEPLSEHVHRKGPRWRDTQMPGYLGRRDFLAVFHRIHMGCKPEGWPWVDLGL